MPTAFAIMGMPVGRFDGRIGAGERDHTLGYIRSEWWNTRGSCFIAQEAVVTSLHEAFLPAPHAGLRLPVRRMISWVPTPFALNKKNCRRARHAYAARCDPERALPDGGGRWA